MEYKFFSIYILDFSIFFITLAKFINPNYVKTNTMNVLVITYKLYYFISFHSNK